MQKKKNIMQETANENAAGFRRIFKRSDQPKTEIKNEAWSNNYRDFFKKKHCHGLLETSVECLLILRLGSGLWICLKCYSRLVRYELGLTLNNPAPAAMSTYIKGSLPHGALRWQVNQFPSVSFLRVPSLCLWILPQKGRLVKDNMAFVFCAASCHLSALDLYNFLRVFRSASQAH